MVLNETEDYNTVGLWYSLQNQDKHSTVIPLSTSLLIQSIPDFKGSAVASSFKSICYYFSIVGFISFQSWRCWRCVAVLQERWATGCLVGYRQQDGRLLCVCAIAQLCSGLPFPSHNGCEVRWPTGGFWLFATGKPCHHSALPEWCAPERELKWACSRISGGWQAAWRQAWAVCPVAAL